MFELLNEKYKITSNIFETQIQSESFAVPNSIILYGPDIIAQYYIAMQLARGANCEGDKTQNCSCRNCIWIKDNEHPAVVTCSKIDFKAEKNDSKTVISVNQINLIKDKLMISSDFHRFFIFCDAELRDYTEDELQKIKNFEKLQIAFPKHDEKENWVPMGLTSKTFTDISANALLKSVEEPPANVTFIFLTESLENIISTIVSRSQTFYVCGNSKQNYDYMFLSEIMKNYPHIDREKSVEISDFLMKYSEESGKSFSYVIYTVQEYLKEILKANSKNIVLKKRILHDIEKLQNIISMVNAGFKTVSAADETGYVLTE